MVFKMSDSEIRGSCKKNQNDWTCRPEWWPTREEVLQTDWNYFAEYSDTSTGITTPVPSTSMQWCGNNVS